MVKYVGVVFRSEKSKEEYKKSPTKVHIWDTIHPYMHSTCTRCNLSVAEAVEFLVEFLGDSASLVRIDSAFECLSQDERLVKDIIE